MPQAAVQPGELSEDDDFTTALYRAAIGTVNTPYYLALFTRWESASRCRPHWNTAAGLWTIGWLLFRKMGAVSMAYVGAVLGSALLIFGVGRLFFSVSEASQITIGVLWLLVTILVPGLWGNVWFHSHCRKRMAKALSAHTEVSESCAALARQSSQPRRALKVGSVQLGLVALLGLGAMQFSSLMRHTGLPSSAKTSTPQMASGKVQDTPSKVATTTATAVTAQQTPVPVAALTPQPAAVAASVPSSAAQVAPSEPPPPAKTPSVTAAVAPTFPPKPTSASSSASASAPEPAQASKRSVTPPPTVVTPQSKTHGVNVGLYAKAANAQTVRTKLKAARLPVLMDTLQLKNGPRIRLRVGPFADEVQAQAAAVKVRALGFDALVY